jgi:hypothetical protein
VNLRKDHYRKAPAAGRMEVVERLRITFAQQREEACLAVPLRAATCGPMRLAFRDVRAVSVGGRRERRTRCL